MYTLCMCTQTCIPPWARIPVGMYVCVYILYYIVLISCMYVYCTHEYINGYICIHAQIMYYMPPAGGVQAPQTSQPVRFHA